MIRVGVAVLGAVALLLSATSASAKLSRSKLLPSCSPSNLEDQTDCFIANALASNNTQAFLRYVDSIYADVNRQTRYCAGYNYYYCAVMAGNVAAVQALATRGANPNVYNASANPTFPVPMSAAIFSQYQRTGRILNGAQVFHVLLDAGLKPWESAGPAEGMIMASAIRLCTIDPTQAKAIAADLKAHDFLALYRKQTSYSVSVLAYLAVSGETILPGGLSCMYPILDSLGLANTTLSSLQAINTYTDAVGATLIDYSMAYFRRDVGKCIYTRGPWRFARYLATKDSAFASEFSAKQRMIGRFFECGLVHY